MDSKSHLERLLSMYEAAPCNETFKSTMTLIEGEAKLALEVNKGYFHSGGFVTGAIYFKVLDETAAFAAFTLEPDWLLVTTSFTTYITRPVSSGNITAIGKVVTSNKTQHLCESIAYDDKGREVARGSGIFVKSKVPFIEAMGYV